ncbi:GGDEF domain-containing protein [Marinicrinis lubricantis]|uniref:GGDEF domain-containing protein n=1 Tax=Marinicrinis lubricantis TaxID=2086470 RepID=A0ABW1ISR0_9BACL
MFVRVERGESRHHLHRKVLNIYWTVLMISIVAMLIAWIIKLQTNADDIPQFLVTSVAIPTVVQLIVIIVIEIVHYYKIEWPWITILSGTLIASALMIANKTIHIQYIFLLSMLVSLFYFSFKQLYIAFVVNMAAFTAIYMMYSEVRESMSSFEISAFVFIMIGMLFILRSVIDRGKEILADHTRMVKKEQELLVKQVLMDRMLKVDALTNLYNHKTFHEYLDMLTEQSNRNSMPLQLAILDIDNFKSINDTFGHTAGDAILTKVAGVLSETFVQNEIAARYGGEEFAVIFPGVAATEAYMLLEQAREKIEQLEHEELDGRKVTVSIGLSMHQQGQSSAQLFTDADSLLYNAKRSGKNKTVI